MRRAAVNGPNRWDRRNARVEGEREGEERSSAGEPNGSWVMVRQRRTAVLKMRTIVPLSDAVARRVPSSVSARHASVPSCAAMNLVRFTSYSSTRTCAERAHCRRVCPTRSTAPWWVAWGL